MTNIHITGDRSLSPVYGPLVAIEMLRAVSEGNSISTGDTGKGIDALVLDLGTRAGIQVEVLGDSDRESVVFIHADAHSSSRLAQFAGLDDDALRLVTASDLLV